MRLKKQKRHRRTVRFYTTCFGFREPFKVLCDGTFIHHLLVNRIAPADSGLSNILGGAVKVFTTRCVLAELKSLGESYSESLKAARELITARCDHEKRKSAVACMMEVVGEKNPEHFFLATQDADLREKLQECGIGGPLINRHGEVIGVNFYDRLCTPFLPINIASKCLEHFKKYGRFCRPLLGMEITNLYAASLGNLDRINLKFPNDSNGVFVEKVIGGSPAECAGILSGDVIVQCAGNFVRSVLELYGIIWDKCGESVEVVVLRSRTGDRLNLTLKVGETSSDKINRWPLPERCRVDVKRVR